MSRTTSWLAWASKQEATAKAYEKDGDHAAAAIYREAARDGLQRADEVFAEERTAKSRS